MPAVNAQTSGCAPPPSGMVSWWAGDGNALDNVGTNNGTVHGGVTFPTGKVGQAFVLDGTSGYVQIPATSAMYPGAGSFTADAWIKTTQSAGTKMVFSIYERGGVNSGEVNSWYGIMIVDGKLYGEMRDTDAGGDPGASGGQGLTGTTNIADGQFHHVAMGRDMVSNKMLIYVDGNLEASGTLNNGSNGTIQDDDGLPDYFFIGAVQDTKHDPVIPAYLFAGTIDEVEIFHRTLSPTEIQAIYNAGSAGMCRQCTAAPVGMVSRWSGEGNALDPRGLNNGSLQNGVSYSVGKVGQSFDLAGYGDNSGNGDRILVGNPVSLQLQDFTIETWVKRASSTIVTNSPAPSPGEGGIIFGFGTGGYGLAIYQSTNQLVLSQMDFPATFSALTVTDTNWHHVAVSKSGSQVTFYLDGVADTPTFFNPTFTFSTNSAIGARGDNMVTDAFFGQIDELAIYDRALSAGEIQAITNSGSAGTCTPTATTLPSGMVAWWGGDGNPSDISGNNNGTLQNGATYAVGKVGQAFSFNGGQYVDVPTSASLNPGANSFSIDAWIYPTVDQPGVIVAKWGDTGAFTNQRAYTVLTNTNRKLLFAISNDADQNVGAFHSFETGPNVIALNAWNHVAAVYDHSTGTRYVYVNGVQVATDTPGAITITNSTADLTIGAQAFSSSPAFFAGGIDEVEFFNRGLAQSEIQAIYNAGLAGKLKTAVTPIGFAARRATRGKIEYPSAVVTTVGDVSITVPTVTTVGITQEIPLDAAKLPALPSGYTSTGLTYDVSTSAVYNGSPTVCFSVPSLSADFSTLRILHLESGGWVDRTNLASVNSNLCTADLPSLSPFAIAKFAPTAANVSVTGRVLTADGRAIRNVRVTIDGPGGEARSSLTNGLGYYRFDDITAGQTYIVSLAAKRFHFAQPSQMVNVMDNIADLDFVAMP